MLINLANEFIMINVSSTYDNDVITEIVGGMEVSHNISINILNIVSVSLCGLT
jgi:hypothetical protein